MRKLLFVPAAALLAAGCSDSTESSVPTAVGVAPATVTLNAVGATQVVHASVTDQKGKTLSSPALTWTSSSPSVTVVGAGGDSAIVTAAANGTASVTAQAGSATGAASVQVAQEVAGADKVAGDAQTGTVAAALPTPVRVRVRDRLNAPIAGQTVTFAVESGGGTLSAATAVTGADGTASVTWTLGTTAGIPQSVRATAGAQTVSFTASGTAAAAATAIVADGNGQSAGGGSPVARAPRVLVRDVYGNAVGGVQVVFTVTSGGGSVTNERPITGFDGAAAVGSWRLGTAAGPNTLTATFPGTSLGALVFTAQSLSLVSANLSIGENGYQAAPVGTVLPDAPTVLVRSPAGAAVPGVTVNFSITSGGGSISTTSAVSDAAGTVTVPGWRLGSTAGINTLTVTGVGITGGAVVLRGVGCSGGGGTGYSITLCITTPMTAAQQAAFQNAAARWATIVRGDLPDVSGLIPEDACSDNAPSANFVYDDLLIFAAVEDIDGPGQILGQAGPCFIRNNRGLPVVGVMAFDGADLASLEASNQLGNVILHEMGHVLGIGSLWQFYGLLQNPSTTTSVLDTYYTGAGGRAGFDAIGGTTYTAGQKVPVENTGGAGTANSHWRENVLRNELMTGYLNSGGANPLSVMTVRSLADLGYTVDVSAADNFFLTLTLRAGGTENTLKMHNDLYTGRRYTISPRGQIARLR